MDVRALKVKGLTEAIKLGCESSDDAAERSAMSSFAQLLESKTPPMGQTVSELEWLSDNEASIGMSGNDQALAVEILEQILGHEDSTQGLVDAVNEYQ